MMFAFAPEPLPPCMLTFSYVPGVVYPLPPGNVATSTALRTPTTWLVIVATALLVAP